MFTNSPALLRVRFSLTDQQRRSFVARWNLNVSSSNSPVTASPITEAEVDGFLSGAVLDRVERELGNGGVSCIVINGVGGDIVFPLFIGEVTIEDLDFADECPNAKNFTPAQNRFVLRGLIDSKAATEATDDEAAERVEFYTQMLEIFDNLYYSNQGN